MFGEGNNVAERRNSTQNSLGAAVIGGGSTGWRLSSAAHFVAVLMLAQPSDDIGRCYDVHGAAVYAWAWRQPL